MNLQEAEQIYNHLTMLEIDVQLHSHYSGRGMFGRECAALSVEDPTMTLARLVAFIPDEKLRHSLAECKQDTLGWGSIYYDPTEGVRS